MKKILAAVLVAVVLISGFSMTVSAASGSYVDYYISSAANDSYGIYLSVDGINIPCGSFTTEWTDFPYCYYVGGIADSSGYFHQAEIFSGGRPIQNWVDWSYQDVAWVLEGEDRGIQNWGNYVLGY